jgi:hypothetical protein
LGRGTFGGTPNLPLLIDSFTFVLCWIIKNWRFFYVLFLDCFENFRKHWPVKTSLCE